MKIYLFYHSIVSDWNHGNAHFLRGMVTALNADHHDVTIYEPLHGWSFSNMIADAGIKPVCEFAERFPGIKVKFFDQDTFTPEILHDADMVIVHEWNSPELISKIGAHKKKQGKYILLFHDTHHRVFSDTDNMKKNDLSEYDGVLAFGNVIRNIYLKRRWAKTAWTWHEAADTSIFKPTQTPSETEGDLVWIGNWGDNERTTEIIEFIIKPVKELGLKAKFYGVRYPSSALKALKDANIEYGGWLPNYLVPEVFKRYKVTVHVPRRPYVEMLPGIPTIRPFEALACGIPLISSPWKDTEGLFRKDSDFLMVSNSNEMKKSLKMLLTDENIRQNIISNGLQTIQSRHTCIHRKNELMDIYRELKGATPVKKNIVSSRLKINI